VGGANHVGAPHIDRTREWPDVLGVAFGHSDDGGFKLDRFPCAALPAAAAIFAHGHRNLVVGAAGVGWAAEYMTRDEKQRFVVLDVAACVVADLGNCFSKGRECFWSDFEAKDVSTQSGIAGIARAISRGVSSDELFDLTNRAPSRNFEPLVLRFCNRNARELPRGRPMYGAVAKAPFELGQLFECLGNTKTLFGPSWLVAEQPLHVFRKARKSEVHVGAAPKAGEQGAAFFPIEARAALCEAS
jgi:hypothetical protein